MIKRRVEESPFVVVRRGYERAQVDAYLVEQSRWSTAAWARIQQLEAKVSELEDLAVASERDREEAKGLLEQAVADRAAATETLEAAEARASELSEASQRDREIGSRSKEEACEHVDSFIEHIDATAADRTSAVIEATTPLLEELRGEFERIEDRRRSALSALTVLRESLGPIPGNSTNGDGALPIESLAVAVAGESRWTREPRRGEGVSESS